MTREELDLYIARANRFLGSQHPGFTICSAVQYDPPIIAYDFDNNEHAEQFIFTRQLMETMFRLQIDSANDCRVLEHR